MAAYCVSRLSGKPYDESSALRQRPQTAVWPLPSELLTRGLTSGCGLDVRHQERRASAPVSRRSRSATRCVDRPSSGARHARRLLNHVDRVEASAAPDDSRPLPNAPRPAHSAGSRSESPHRHLTWHGSLLARAARAAVRIDRRRGVPPPLGHAPDCRGGRADRTVALQSDGCGGRACCRAPCRKHRRG